ncbi:MAG: preprotein translocase subunit YajC [Clostridia bacterium]|nr:preprotein translocase subunit YajC [Clostridia bacterium]
MNITQIMTLGADTSQIIWIVVLIVLMIGMFAMSIIPQKKRQKKTQEMIDSITVGTKVKTIGGFVGEVKKVDVANKTFTLDLSADGDGSTMVVIDRSAVFIVLEAVKTSEGEVKLQEKPEITAMDDMEADKAAQEKKAKKSDSLDKTDNETLLKD